MSPFFLRQVEGWNIFLTEEEDQLVTMMMWWLASLRPGPGESLCLCGWPRHSRLQTFPAPSLTSNRARAPRNGMLEEGNGSRSGYYECLLGNLLLCVMCVLRVCLDVTFCVFYWGDNDGSSGSVLSERGSSISFLLSPLRCISVIAMWRMTPIPPSLGHRSSRPLERRFLSPSSWVSIIVGS